MPIPPYQQRPGEGLFDEGGIFGQVGETLRQKAGVYGDAGRRLLEWNQKMLVSSVPNVASVLLEDCPCEVEFKDEHGHLQPCEARALFRCLFCRGLACEGHAWAACDGTSICVSCVRKLGEVMGRATPKAKNTWGPKPPPEARTGRAPNPNAPPTVAQVEAALSVFGLTRKSKWDDVRSRYKTLVKTSHPDRYKGDLPKEEVTRRFQEITDAYALLSRVHDAAKAKGVAL